ANGAEASNSVQRRGRSSRQKNFRGLEASRISETRTSRQSSRGFARPDMWTARTCCWRRGFTQVDGRRRRHSRGGHDGAQCDTVKDGPVVGLRDPRPDWPHDRGGFHGYSPALAHCDMGPTGCDASMSKCEVPSSGHDASMSGCDVTSSGDASMPNRDVLGSDGDTSMSDCDMTGHRDTFT